MCILGLRPSVKDSATGDCLLEERLMREVTRLTDIDRLLFRDRDVLAEYECAMNALGPFLDEVQGLNGYGQKPVSYTHLTLPTKLEV